jgi:protein-disulfide isomerase
MRAAAFSLLVLALAACGGAGESDEPRGLLDGIPQEGVVLGDPDAPVTLVEFADLQCPYCARFTRTAFAVIVEEFVRTGEVRLVFRGVAFLGPDSEKALRAVLAAGQQRKLWQLVELLYAHQGPENSGWVTDELVRELGGGVEGLDVERMMAERTSEAVEVELALAAQAADRARVDGTPTFWAGPTDEPLRLLAKGAAEAAAFRSALAGLLGGTAREAA